MKVIHVLILSLVAVGVCSAAGPRKKKAAAPQPVSEKVQPVPADTFSYAMGVAQSQGLRVYLQQREGVDSAHVAFVVKALADAAQMSEEQMQQSLAYAAGLRIALMNRLQVIPTLNQQATGKRDTTYTDLALFTRGLTDALTGAAKLKADSAMAIVDRQMKFYQAQLKERSAAFLAENAKREGVKTTASGLQYRVIKQGTGPVATDTTAVDVHYEGKLIDGTVFDSSYRRGKPATFRPNQVIKGWTEALKMMPEGSVYELYIPYNLGYGERGTQNIPPYSTLIFKVELLKVKP